MTVVLKIGRHELMTKGNVSRMRTNFESASFSIQIPFVRSHSFGWLPSVAQRRNGLITLILLNRGILKLLVLFAASVAAAALRLF